MAREVGALSIPLTYLHMVRRVGLEKEKPVPPSPAKGFSVDCAGGDCEGTSGVTLVWLCGEGPFQIGGKIRSNVPPQGESPPTSSIIAMCNEGLVGKLTISSYCKL
jgi:hypothetical protein